MHFKSWKQQLMEAMAVLFVVSFVVHIVAFWLAPLAYVLLVMGLLAVVARLVFGWRR